MRRSTREEIRFLHSSNILNAIEKYFKIFTVCVPIKMILKMALILTWLAEDSLGAQKYTTNYTCIGKTKREV